MSSRTLKITCAVSILLNLFLLGAAVGGAAWVRARDPMIGAGPMRIAGSELPRDERRAFRRALHDARRDMRPTAIARRAAREQAATLLRAPVLDQAKLADALARIRAADFAIRTHVEERAIGFAATLPPDARAQLAARVAPHNNNVAAGATELQP
jgi:uncharacterized membrane protein